jgi:hypothetical protein
MNASRFLVSSREVPLRFRVLKTLNAAAIEMLSFVAVRRLFTRMKKAQFGFTPGPGQYVYTWYPHTPIGHSSLVANARWTGLDGFVY